jgi:Spy/CpxP family protein refolding chaperone
MKTTKSLMLAALAAGGLLAGSLAAQAQETTTTNAPAAGHVRGHDGFDQFAKRFDLTAQQETKVKAAFENFRQQVRALQKETTLTPAEKRAKAKELRAGLTAQLKTIMTPQQFAKWQEMEPSHHRPGTGSSPKN